MELFPQYRKTGDTSRGPSPGVWYKCPLVQLQLGLGGVLFHDDFANGLPDGKYTATQATAGTFALGDGDGGVALADCNSTTATQGINVQLGGAAGELFKPAAGRKLWFEARFKFADVATGPEFFLGLHEIDTTIIVASALTGGNMIGFSSITDDNVLLFTAEKATAAATKACTTAVDGTFLKLGFFVDGVTSIQQYLNGALLAGEHVSANIPIVEMVPSLVCQSGGTTDPIVHLDWWMCGIQYE